MKSLRSILTAVFAALLLAAVAQAQQTKVQATIPFPFVVGNIQYPAGEYALKSLTGGGPVILVTDTDGTNPSMTMSQACESSAPSEVTKLVFHRMGDNLFLYQIWTAGSERGREFPVSKTERQLAQNHEPSEAVIVAARLIH